MSDKKQRRPPKIREKWENREDGSDVNPNKKVAAGDVHDLLTSHMSKPVVRECTLPEIGNGELMKKQTGNTLLPPLQVQAVAQQRVKKLSKRSSASRHGFEEVPALPAVVKQDCSNREGSQLKRDALLPVHLPPIEKMTQSSSSSSWAAGHKPETAVLRPTAELNNLCKLPDIKNAKVKPSRPTSGNMHRLSYVLPPISETKEELHKELKLPRLANVQRVESPRTDKAKKKKTKM